MRRPRAFLSLALCILAGAAACGGSDEPGPRGKGGRGGPDICEPTAVDDLSALPEDFPLDDFGIVHRVTKKRGYVGAIVMSEDKIVQLHPEIARLVRAGGYETLFSENEGFEAELLFRKGKKINGAFRLREGPCAGQVTINFLFGRLPGS